MDTNLTRRGFLIGSAALVAITAIDKTALNSFRIPEKDKVVEATLIRKGILIDTVSIDYGTVDYTGYSLIDRKPSIFSILLQGSCDVETRTKLIEDLGIVKHWEFRTGSFVGIKGDFILTEIISSDTVYDFPVFSAALVSTSRLESTRCQ